MLKVAFLDRDGVINKEVGYLHNIKDFQYTKNCISALKNLRRLGFELIVVTNQAGIAHGLYTDKDYQTLTEWLIDDLREEGVNLLDIFYALIIQMVKSRCIRVLAPAASPSLGCSTLRRTSTE